MEKKHLIIGCLLLISLVSCASGRRKFSKPEVTDDGRRIYKNEKDPALRKAAAIEGFVYTYDKHKQVPVKNARVEIKNANLGMGYYLLKTDSDGYFKIKDFVPYVDYVIEVVADGYVNYKSKGKIYPGKQNIFLAKEAVFTGKVKDSRGRGISDVIVKLQKSRYSSSGSNKPVMIKTDKSGKYIFKKLPDGRYYATYSKPGYITETAAIKNINSGETFAFQMQLFKPASINGIIKIDKLKTAAINVNVYAEGKRGQSTRTYHDGSFRLEELKPGRYKLHITHQGFYKLDSTWINLREGEQKKKVNFTVVPRPPEAYVYAHRYTFVPGNKLAFNMRTFRLEKVKATVYRVPLNTFVRGRSNPERLNPKKERFKVKIRWDEPIHNFKPYEWKYQTLEIKDPLPTGGYCVEIKGAGRVISRKFFTVTSTGVVVKRSQYSVFTYVTSLITNKPLADSRVVIFDSTPTKKQYRNLNYPYKPPKRIEDLPIKIVYKGKTDKNGLFKYKLKTRKHLTVMVIGPDGSYALCSTGSPYTFEREKNKYFIYTDRPVYRSGDTVFYKIIGKTRKERFFARKGARLFYKIRNRDRRKTVTEGSIRLDQWGTANSKIKIQERFGLGDYEIRVGPAKKNLYAVGRFYVEQYRKPEFKIEITPAKDYFINGDTAEFRIEGKYFFGAPLKGALVHYRFYETRLRDSDTRYWWEDDYPANRSFNRIKLEGDKYLDNNGVAALRLDAGTYPYDREITVEATIVDKSNISITSSYKVKIGRGEYYIKINPRKNFFADNEKKNILIKTLRHTGKPMAAKVTLEMYRYIWKPYQRVYVHDKRPLFKTTLSTNSKGEYLVELPRKFSHYGEFDLILSGQDKRNNKITASRVIWIYSKHGAPIKSRFRNLELAVNKTKLKKSDKTLTCLIKSRFSDAFVCLTLEGKDVYYSKVVRMQGNITPVTIPVKAVYAPNFYLSATMQRKRALFTSVKNISIPVKNTDLNIKITPARKIYLPGEKAKINFLATDEDGKPVVADLSLGVVDESIYYIRPDHTPRMSNYFYTKISNWVLTSYSYPINVLAGAAKEGKVKVRTKFEDTAFWKANIRTNKKGKASIRFTLPDNLTTWRLTARGHDRTGRVGENKNKFMVTQDLVARLGKPRFLIEGDELGIIGIVNSNTMRGLPKVKTKMLIDGKVVAADKKMKISLPAFGATRNYYTFKVPSKKEQVSVQFEARADHKAKDALRINVPIQKRGSAYKLYGIGDMLHNKNVTLAPLKDSKDFKFVPEKLTIALNPSPILQLLKATDYLVAYPYGCVEQTVNRFFPLVAVQQLLKKRDMESLIDKKKLARIPAMTRLGIKRLGQMQNDDGSWGWFSGDRGNEFLTAYVMYSFYLIQKFGYKINYSTISKGKSAIGRMLNQNSNVLSYDARAFLLYVYACWGGWHNDAYHYLESYRDKTIYQKAFIIKALSLKKDNPEKYIKDREKRNEKIAQLKKERNARIAKNIKNLKQHLKKDGKGVYWASYGCQRWGWPGQNTEMTAHVLSALVHGNDKSSLPAQILKSLSRRSQGGYWQTTKQTASVILSVCEYMQKSSNVTGKKANINFKMGGKKVASISYDPKKIEDTEDLVRVVKLKGHDPKKSIQIIASGVAGPDVSYDLTVAGTLYYKPNIFLSIFKSEERSLDSLTNGLQVYRTFSGIARVKDMNNQEYMVQQSMANKKILRIGDELLVKVKFLAQDNFEYLVLEDYLPSGFEVVKKNAYDIYKPYVHLERWDNRMVYFFTNLRKGEIYEVAYIIRAELPGKFMVRPTRMECMYEPSIQGWSAPSNVKVNKK